MTNITVSLETAKKLKEAGRDKETILCRDYFGQSPNRVREICLTRDKDDYIERILAPTAQEILEEFNSVDIAIHWSYPDWRAVHIPLDYAGRGENLAEALADLRLRCKEQGYILPPPL